MANFLNPGKGRRNPLSGSGSGHTAGDGINLGGLYLECKYRAKMAAVTLHDDTRNKAKKENLLPVTVMHAANTKGFLIAVHSDDLDEFVRIITNNRRLPDDAA